MAYFEPLADVLNKNCSRKLILYPLKHTLDIYIFLEAGFGDKWAFHTGINRAKNDDRM